MNVDMNDFKLALAGWYVAMDSEAGSRDDVFEDADLKKLIEKYEN